MPRELGSPKSPIFMLPDEVLIRIFRYFVDTDKDHSPEPLPHVCRLFRQLALATSGLWNIIDLGWSVERVKQRLRLAQQQPLIVLWSVVGALDVALQRKYERIVFSKASRFLELVLNIRGTTMCSIFGRFGNALSQLQELTLDGQGTLFPRQLRSLPNLRHFVLSQMVVGGPEFMGFLHSCTLLEKLALVDVAVLNVDKWESKTPGPVRLPHLTLCLISFYTFSESHRGWFTSSIILPKHCVLHIIPRKNTVAETSCDAIPSDVVAVLQPIRFTTVHLRASSLLYVEDPHDSRCTLHLELSTVGHLGARRTPWCALKLHGSDTIPLTLNIDAGALEWILEDTQALSSLIRMAPQIRELVIRGYMLQGLEAHHSRRMINFFAKSSPLEALVLREVNLDARQDSGLKNMHIIREIVRRMQSPKAPRLVLRGCMTDQEGLTLLRKLLPVDCSNVHDQYRDIYERE